jgi:hypothetical protein
LDVPYIIALVACGMWLGLLAADNYRDAGTLVAVWNLEAILDIDNKCWYY